MQPPTQLETKVVIDGVTVDTILDRGVDNRNEFRIGGVEKKASIDSDC